MENKIKWGVIGSGGIARRRTIPEGIMHADHAILEKREPKNNITLGLQSQKILAACYESAKTRKIIEIN